KNSGLDGRSLLPQLKSQAPIYIYNKEDISKEEIKSKDINKLMTILSETDAVEHARARLKFYLGKAKDIAGSLRSEQKKEGLLKVCSFFEQEVGGNK
ncbi:MAG: hypothetical protein ABUK08_08815, partial [Candidatus Humimicrobiaceae bacterium]